MAGIEGKAETGASLAVQIKLWEPVPNHATFIIGNNGTLRGEIIFSNLRGFVSGAELLENPLTTRRLLEKIYEVAATVDGPCQQNLLQHCLDRLNERDGNQT